MRPIKLTLSAFGPFAAIEEIDFATLGDNPLFLINGPTGSGKTTILDGICYALYGKTTGDERDASQMRCDAAAADCLTYVELVFSLGEESWRIRREPDQLRPKGRGEGLTAHQPRAEIYRRERDGDESVVVASKVTEARLFIEALVGLNVDQFRQVMVLPQGEFRNLLLARSADRERVFSHLFQTRIYSRIENALKERAATVRREVDATRNQCSGILQSVDLEDEGQLQKELESAAARHVPALENREQALKQQQQAHAALHNGEKLAADFERLEREQKRLADLQSRNTEIEALQQQINRAQQALSIQPDFERWQQAREVVKDLRRRGKEIEQSAEKARAELRLAEQSLQRTQGMKAEIESGRGELSRLHAYRERVTQFEAAKDDLRESEQAKIKSGHMLERLREEHEQARQKLETSEQAQQALLERLRGLGEQRLEQQQLTQQYRDRQSLEALQSDIRNKQREVARKRRRRGVLADRLEQCLGEETRLEMEWHRGQAILLAAKLEPDQPCPVCGSRSHPAPAHSEVNIPAVEAREAAAAASQQARQALEELGTELTRLETGLQAALDNEAALRETTAEIDARSLPEMAARIDALAQDIKTLESEQLHEQAYAEGISRERAQLKQCENALAEATARHTDALTGHEVARKQWLLAEQGLPQRYRESAELESAIQALDFRLNEFEQQLESARERVANSQLALGREQTRLESQGQQLEAATEGLQAARERWETRLEASPLQEEAGFLSARLSAENISLLEGEVSQYRAELDQARGAVDSLGRALAQEARPDLTELERNAKQADLALEQAEARFQEIDRRFQRLQSVGLKLEKLANNLKTLEQQYALVGTLADTANGRTGSRISLQRFVLSVLLDDVLVMASQRFRQMSKGRYALYRQQEKGKGGAAAGLDLVVDDAYSGKQRPVATLSGGESFMAALSLALGLSDVVQAYAGGIRLDALFVDEGFGSLDPESLDLAISTLMDLHRSGRMVGVISHVPELKERIKVRLDVIADRNGSHTQVVTA